MQIALTPRLASRVVSKLPICRFCLEEAAYEGKTIYGYQASLCSRDFKRVGLNLNEAHRLIVIEPVSRSFWQGHFTPKQRLIPGQYSRAMAPAFA